MKSFCAFFTARVLDRFSVARNFEEKENMRSNEARVTERYGDLTTDVRAGEASSLVALGLAGSAPWRPFRACAPKPLTA